MTYFIDHESRSNLFYFLKIFKFILERERGTERENEQKQKRRSNRLPMSKEPNMGLDPRTLGS